METNILRILSVEAKEDAISNLLAYSFRESADFRRRFTRALCGELFGCSRVGVVATRTSIPDVGIPDIVIACQDGDGTDLIVVENKLMAEAGNDQTVPRTHFNIHFELQYDVLKSVFKMYLHYEINPYQTEKWAQDKISAEFYEEYVRVRARFKTELKEAGVLEFVVGGRSNQVARATLDLKGKSVGDATEVIGRIVATTAPVVDGLIARGVRPPAGS
jgi:hypothetical protein